MFFAFPDRIRVVKWSPQRHLLGAGGMSGQFLLYDPMRQMRLHIVGKSDDTSSFSLQNCSWLPSSTKKYVALGSTSGYVEIWDVNAGKLLRSYVEHSPQVASPSWYPYPDRKTICAVAWSPNRTYIASTGDDGEVRVWRAETGATCCTMRLEAHYPSHLLAWLADNHTLVSSARDEIVVWDAFAGQVLCRIQTPCPYYYYDNQGCRAVSPDGKNVAIAAGSVVIYNLVTGASVRSYHLPADEDERSPSAPPGPFDLVSWSPNGKWLATTFSQRPRRIFVWDARSGETLFRCKSHGDIWCLDWSFDSKLLAWGGDGYLETTALSDPFVPSSHA